MKNTKNIRLVYCLLLLTIANIVEAQVQTKIEKVTVFQNGAQITRVAKVFINAGTNSIKFVGISPYLNPNSIQVKGDGDFTILSVVHQINYLNEQKKKDDIINLEKQKETLSDNIQKNRKLLEVYQREEELILANKQIGGQNDGVKISELKETVEFVRNRLTEIKMKQIDINKLIEDYNKELIKVNNQLYELNAYQKVQTSEVILTVKCNNQLSTDLYLSYYVQNASWRPVYDIRVKDVDNPVNLSYKANVKQFTGEDWNDVKLTISSANPSISGIKQDLQTWFLNFSVLPVYKAVSGKTLGGAVIPGATSTIRSRDSKDVSDNFTITEHQYGFDFNVDIPYNIPSDGKEYTVEMKNYKVPASYEYACSPKLSTDVFLLAQITGWEDYNLLDGEANIFFESTFISKSFLNVQNTKDTLSLSLGRDENIVVTRNKMKDFSSKQSIGNKQRASLAYEINIRNKRKQAINLTIDDQLPIPSNKEIEIEDSEYTEGQLNKETGIITWKMKLNPGENKKLNLKFTVKYPKDKVLYLR